MNWNVLEALQFQINEFKIHWQSGKTIIHTNFLP